MVSKVVLVLALVVVVCTVLADAGAYKRGYLKRDNSNFLKRQDADSSELWKRGAYKRGYLKRQDADSSELWKRGAYKRGYLKRDNSNFLKREDAPTTCEHGDGVKWTDEDGYNCECNMNAGPNGSKLPGIVCYKNL